MRQTTRFLNPYRCVVITLISTLVAGCTLPPHNNTLIFAVNRKVGIDISPTNAANAGLTIGYSSNELAWVPLWANDKDGKPMVECQSNSSKVETKPDKTETKTSPHPENCTAKARFTGLNSEAGVSGKDEDSYSVFASFGGAVAAQTDAGQPSASLNIASFFATGIAAQQLAENAHGLTAVASDGEKKIKLTSTAAYKGAEKELRAFLTMTAESSDKKPIAVKLCLDKLQAEYGDKAPTQFNWVAGRSPSNAATALLTNSSWSEAELNKLNGAAYRLAQKGQAEIEKKENKDKNKYLVARKAIDCASDDDINALNAVANAPAPAASAPAANSTATK